MSLMINFISSSHVNLLSYKILSQGNSPLITHCFQVAVSWSAYQTITIEQQLFELKYLTEFVENKCRNIRDVDQSDSDSNVSDSKISSAWSSQLYTSWLEYEEKIRDLEPKKHLIELGFGSELFEKSCKLINYDYQTLFRSDYSHSDELAYQRSVCSDIEGKQKIIRLFSKETEFFDFRKSVLNDLEFNLNSSIEYLNTALELADNILDFADQEASDCVDEEAMTEPDDDDDDGWVKLPCPDMDTSPDGIRKRNS